MPLWLGAAAAIPAPALPRTLAFAAGTARFAALLRADAAAPARRTAAGTVFGPAWARGVYAAGGLAALALGLRGRPRPALLAAGAGGAATLGVVAFLRERFGGAARGDVYGAAIVTGETLLLALVALTAARS